MKVLVISAAFPPLRAGEADHALHLCQHLADRGLDIHVLTTKRKVATSHFPFKVYPIMPHWLWRDLPRLVRFLKVCSPDAVLLIYTPRDYNYHPMITFAPTITKALLPRSRFVTQFETGLFGRQGSILTRAILTASALCAGPKRLDDTFGTLLCKSDRIIVLSERHRDRLLESLPSINSKIAVIPPPPVMRICPESNGAYRERGREALGVNPDDFLLAHFGYIYEEKGMETLLKAFQISNTQRNNTRLVMVGASMAEGHDPSYVNAIRELAKQLGIDNKVSWTGEYAPDSDQASLYLRAADACVFPFNYGVTMNRSSVATAAAHGLPIVTTKGSIVESPFIDGENVFLCPPRDPNSLALAIESLISNPELRQRLRLGALQLAQECFSWDKAVERTCQALSP
ncbi:MAG: glycosyltransferase family 4 protein [Candidatus Binatia bacterium]